MATKRKSVKVALSEYFCVTCRKKSAVQDATLVMLKNNHKAATGQCTTCNNKVYQIVPMSTVTA